MTKEKVNLSSYTIFSNNLFVKEDLEIPYYKEYDDHVESKASNNYIVLEQYYNDIYKLFLNKLSKFDYQGISTEDERTKLKDLFNEIIRVKMLLEENR